MRAVRVSWVRPAYDDPARAPEPPGHPTIDTAECQACHWWQRPGAGDPTWGVCSAAPLRGSLTHQWYACPAWVACEPEEVASCLAAERAQQELRDRLIHARIREGRR